MDHNNDTKHKKPIYYIFKRKCLMAFMCIIVAVCIIFGIKPIRKIALTCYIRLVSAIENNKMNETPNIKAGDLSIQAAEPEKENYTFIEKEPDDIYKGDLVLVNSSHMYHFLEDGKLVSLKKNKNNAYKLMDKKMKVSRKMVQALNKMMKDFESVSGKHDMIITSAYRSLKEQEEAFEEKVEEFGETDAFRWAMLPGYSEHHTGDAVDMSIYTDDEIYINYIGQNDYAWINQNCFKYGIIRRYTEEKTAITGVSNEPWHYRYVGIPHAYLMTIHQFCFEEYIDYIRNYSFDQEHLYISAGEGDYEIYYVPADQASKTRVPVPQNEVYTVSGNNIDGFIVTVDLKKNEEK